MPVKWRDVEQGSRWRIRIRTRSGDSDSERRFGLGAALQSESGPRNAHVKKSVASVSQISPLSLASLSSVSCLEAADRALIQSGVRDRTLFRSDSHIPGGACRSGTRWGSGAGQRAPTSPS